MVVKRAFAAGLLLIVAILMLIAAGSLRYGGPGGLLLRVQAEFNRRPQELLVPTPLPTAEVPAPSAAPTECACGAASATPVAASPSATMETPADPEATSTTELPTITEEPSPTAEATQAAAAPAVELTGFAHEWQGWNNCGPATLAMYLSYYGNTENQTDIANVVKENKDDKHVGADELVEYVRSRGFQAILRVNGDAQKVKSLLNEGIPVMVATWNEQEPGDGAGHYRLITGYDDALGEWILYDSLLATARGITTPYEGIRISYEELDELWEVLNYKYILVYREDHAVAVPNILGEDMDDALMWAGALAASQAAVEQRPENPFVWFNLGTSLVAAERWDEAAAAYDRARQIGLPWRMLWYQFEPLQAYYEAGRLQEVVALADATMAHTKDLEELYYWKGMALQALGDPDSARANLERATQLRPSFTSASEALQALE